VVAVSRHAQSTCRYSDKANGEIETVAYDLTGTISPIPESSTWAMMLVGLAGLGLAGYRTSRKAASAGV
jgi:hypothetical protein